MTSKWEKCKNKVHQELKRKENRSKIENDSIKKYKNKTKQKNNNQHKNEWKLNQTEKKKNKLVRFGLVWFYSISTIVGYLMPNPFLYLYTVLFQTIQFSTNTEFSSISPIDRALSSATTQNQSGPWSDGNEGVLRIPQISSITEASPSDCLVLYTRHSLGESYPSAEKQSVYSTAPVNWAK